MDTNTGKQQHRTFISYSSNDANFVDKLRLALAELGLSAWVDHENIRGGEQWIKSLANTLDNSTVLLVIISPDSVRSHWVSQEISYAVLHQIPVIPVVYRSTKYPPAIDFLIGNIQRIDFVDKEFDNAVGELAQSIQDLAKQPSQPVEGAKRADVNLEFYQEDIFEFLQRVPATMIWRFGRLGDLSLWQTIYRVIVFSNPGLLQLVIFNLVLISVVIGTLQLFFPLPDHPAIDMLYPNRLAEDIAVGAAIAFGTALSQYLGKKFVWRTLKRLIPKVYPDMPYRPGAQVPNLLLDRWDEHVEPIIWQLLDEPHQQWFDYLERRVQDKELLARVVFSMVILVGLTSK